MSDSYTGKLVMTGGGSYWLLLDEEKEVAIPVEFVDKELAKSVPLNAPIKLEGIISEKGYLLSSCNYTAKAQAPGLRDNRKHHILAWKIPVDADEDTFKRYEGYAKQRAINVEGFWKFFAGHVWDIRVEGMAIRTDAYHGVPYFGRNDIMTAYNENPIDDFHPNYTYSIGQWDADYCGQHALGGSAGATYAHRGRVCSEDTEPHEFGHGYGSLHAKRLKPDGSIEEYGDARAEMGEGKGLNSVNYIVLGLDEDKSIEVVTENTALLLAPVELDPAAVHPEETQIAIVRGERRADDLYLSTRKIKGYPYNTGTQEQRLYIHKKDDVASIEVASLEEGERYFAETGSIIGFADTENETLLADIQFTSNADEPDVPQLPEGFPPAPPSEQPTEAMNGLWWHPDQSHQGFDIRVKDGRIGFLWYTYDAQGKPRYYTATQTVDKASIGFDVHTTVNGTFDDPGKANIKPIGRGQLYFTSQDTAVFNFDTTEHGRGTIRLSRLVQSTAEVDGWYYDPERDGEGFGVVTDEKGNRLVYWYTYTDQPNRGEQDWFVINHRQNIHGPILRPSGGKFMRLSNSKLNAVGQAYSQFIDGELDVQSAFGDGRTGTRRCRRLF